MVKIGLPYPGEKRYLIEVLGVGPKEPKEGTPLRQQATLVRLVTPHFHQGRLIAVSPWMNSDYVGGARNAGEKNGDFLTNVDPEKIRIFAGTPDDGQVCIYRNGFHRLVPPSERTVTEVQRGILRGRQEAKRRNCLFWSLLLTTQNQA